MRDGTPSDGPGWRLRVVPNRVPALRVEATLDHRGDGLFERMNGLGAHEVVVETPRHDATWATLPVEDLTLVLAAWRDRMADLQRDSRLRAALVFKNEGVKAGARLAHPHSQVVAMPVVPPRRWPRRWPARAVTSRRPAGACTATLVEQELAAGTRVIASTAAAVVLAPFAARWPFETWLLPRAHHARFEAGAGIAAGRASPRRCSRCCGPSPPAWRSRP